MNFPRSGRFLEITRVALAASLALLVAAIFQGRAAVAAETSGLPVNSMNGLPFDAAPFGGATYDAQQHSYAIQWGEPRKVRRVVVEFPQDSRPPAAEKVRLQYWHQAWDGKPDPVLVETGACRAGWTRVDDWTNGQWKDADARCQAQGKGWTFTFAPSGEKEFPNLGLPGVAYRKTLKIRLLSEEQLPQPARFQALTDAVYRPLTVRIHWGEPALKGSDKRGTGTSPLRRPQQSYGNRGSKPVPVLSESLALGQQDSGRLEVFNGVLRGLRPVAETGATVEADMQWRLPGNLGSLEADLLVAVDPVNQQYDRTIITVRSQSRPFSFVADDVAGGQRILVDDLGVLVVRGDDPVGLDGYRQARRELPGRTVYDRVLDMPEQTLSGAWNDMPLKRPLYFVHGLPGNRNTVRQDPNGEIAITSNAHWFELPSSPKDSQRKGWEGGWLSLGFGLPSDDHRAGRELREGYLPFLRTWWVDGPIYYEQCTILGKLDGKLDDVRLDDPTLLSMQIRVLNLSASEPGIARLHLTSDAGGSSEKLVLRKDRVLAGSKNQDRLRYLFETGDGGTITEAGNALDWSLELAPGQSHTLVAMIPTITLTKEEEIKSLRRRDFAADSRQVCQFWKDLTEKTTQIRTPEPWLNDFYKSHLRHLEVNCLRDVNAPRRYAHVGTFHYGAFSNESAMMVSDLDRRGCHQAAERCLQTWLDFQGTVPLPGNFQSADGLFYGAGGHEHGGYNKHHGYVMWCMAEHWRYSRDRQWMERAAPKLVKACDWVIRERRSTISHRNDGSRPIEYGFLPSGGLEDVQDYWYWMATNACTVWGFDALSGALADYGDPEAARLQREAKAYHDDVVRGLEEARIRTAVVRLRDGTHVPKYPSHLHERGRSVGWIRETLEGSLVLLLTGLIPPDAPQAAWILKDYEDNLYISDQYGYSIPVFDQFWFSRGGFSMQANLLDGPIPYLQRDEVRHYLRAFFNGFSSAFYPEIRMCNEHSNPELGYPAGDHFKSSDEAQVTYWLRLMFVHERGDELILGQALPRYWLADGKTVAIRRAASYFGPLGLDIHCEAGQKRITAVLAPPDRNPPKKIYLRLRHPDGKPIQSVTLNGVKYEQFDADHEWVVLPGTLQGKQEIVARY